MTVALVVLIEALVIVGAVVVGIFALAYAAGLRRELHRSAAIRARVCLAGRNQRCARLALDGQPYCAEHAWMGGYRDVVR